jgi:rod shape-determining protein MreD
VTTRTFRIVALVIALVIVQFGVLAQITVAGVHLDVLLLATVCTGLARGPRAGLLVGFAFGLLQDVFLASPLGLMALGYAVGGFVAGVLSDGIDELPWVQMALSALGCVVALTLFVVVGHVLGDVDVAASRALRIITVISVVDAVCAPLLVRATRSLSVPVREVSW